MLVHIIRELLVTHPREPIADVLQVHPVGEVRYEEHGVQEGEGGAERVAYEGDGGRLVDVGDDFVDDGDVDGDGGACVVVGEPSVDLDGGRELGGGKERGIEVGHEDVGVVEECLAGSSC